MDLLRLSLWAWLKHILPRDQQQLHIFIISRLTSNRQFWGSCQDEVLNIFEHRRVHICTIATIWQVPQVFGFPNKSHVKSWSSCSYTLTFQKLQMIHGKIHYKWSCSIQLAMFNYQRVFPPSNPIKPAFSYGFPMVFQHLPILALLRLSLPAE